MNIPTQPQPKIQTGINNPILRTISEEVKEITEEIINFCNTLLIAMREYKGVGLAAPQIGKNIRIIATSQREKIGKKEKFLGITIMINPKIVEKSKETILSEEACISLPNYTGTVKRHKTIKVEFLTIEGKKQIKKYKDFNAVIIQHEIDHLDGILFVDKIEQTKIKKITNHKKI